MIYEYSSYEPYSFIIFFEKASNRHSRALFHRTHTNSVEFQSLLTILCYSDNDCPGSALCLPDSYRTVRI